MATTYLRAESAHANPLNIFATFDRATLAKTVEVLVCVLDAMDGDPDVEDATNAEDEGIDPLYNAMDGSHMGAGCVASDEGGGNVDDGPHDPEEDLCLAGDDGVFAGPAVNSLEWLRWASHNIGNEDDAEPETWASWMDHPAEGHVGNRPGHTEPAKN